MYLHAARRVGEQELTIGDVVQGTGIAVFGQLLGPLASGPAVGVGEARFPLARE